MEQIIATGSRNQHAAFLLLVGSGMRIGKLIWLTWEDFDLGRMVLHVRPKEGWKPKSGDQRSVPMTPRVHALLSGLTRRGRWILCAGASSRHRLSGPQTPA